MQFYQLNENLKMSQNVTNFDKRMSCSGGHRIFHMRERQPMEGPFS